MGSKSLQFQDKFPENIDDGSLPNNFWSTAKGKDFIIMEGVKGTPFRIFISKSKTTVSSMEYNEEIVNHINLHFIRALSKAFHYFGQNEITIYGQYINENNTPSKYSGNRMIYFYDLFINNNWIRNDDYINLFRKFGLNTPPILYNGTILKDYSSSVQKILNGKSSIKGLDSVHSLYVKSLNGIGIHNSIKKGAYFIDNPKFVVRKKEENENSQKDSKIEKEIRDYVDYTLDSDFVSKWEIVLKAKGLELNSKNIQNIMSTIVSSYILSNKEEIEILSFDLNISKKDVEKKIKNYLGKVVPKILKIK
jgi:hypothetical protein